MHRLRGKLSHFTIGTVEGIDRKAQIRQVVGGRWRCERPPRGGDQKIGSEEEKRIPGVVVWENERDNGG